MQLQQACEFACLQIVQLQQSLYAKYYRYDYVKCTQYEHLISRAGWPTNWRHDWTALITVNIFNGGFRDCLLCVDYMWSCLIISLKQGISLSLRWFISGIAISICSSPTMHSNAASVGSSQSFGREQVYWVHLVHSFTTVFISWIKQQTKAVEFLH